VFASTHRSDTASDPAHPDFEAALAVPLTLSKSKQDAFQRRADQVLDSLYPGARAAAVLTHVQLPVLGGGSVVSNTTEKFGAPLSAITDIQVCCAEISIIFIVWCYFAGRAVTFRFQRFCLSEDAPS
jgi:hypothetical protein